MPIMDNKAYYPELSQQVEQNTMFEQRQIDAFNKKQQLLKMARNGDPRPSHYDPEFDNQIRKLRPDWFKK